MACAHDAGSDYRVQPAAVRPMRTKARAILIDALRDAHRWLDELTTDSNNTIASISAREKKTERSIRMTMSLAFLSPALVAASEALLSDVKPEILALGVGADVGAISAWCPHAPHFGSSASLVHKLDTFTVAQRAAPGLLTPFTVRKDERGLMSINAHDA